MGCPVPSPLDSDLLRSFKAVAETGSVTHAAEKIGRTQSALSMQIRRLEDVLGQPLFDRRPRGVDLTSRGEQLLPYARRVIRTLDEAAVALREKPIGGPVRIGIPDEYATSLLPRVLADFSDRHPDIEISILLDYSAHQMTALAEDRVDLAVLFESAEPTSGEVLCIDPTVWTCSVAHRLHLRRPVPIAGYLRSCWCQDIAIGSLKRHGIPYRLAFECDTSSGLRDAVRAGLAVAPLARSTIPPGCRELAIDDGFPLIDSSRVVLYRNPRGSTAAAEAFAIMLREAFRPLASGKPT